LIKKKNRNLILKKIIKYNSLVSKKLNARRNNKVSVSLFEINTVIDDYLKNKKIQLTDLKNFSKLWGKSSYQISYYKI
jgi:hypothetical protein